MSKEFTTAEVSKHSTKKDLYVVVDGKVYNVTKFVDEHPGGREVLLDVGGKDATEAFEDVGHSDEARTILAGLLIGNLKRVPGESKSTKTVKPVKSSPSSNGIGLYVIVAVGILVAMGAYKYMEFQQQD